MQFDESVRYLLSLGHETLALKLGLETTAILLKALGEPQKFLSSVQIAGTNGKGSTAVVLESIACRAGIKTGLYTSPHLVDITERIRINGRQISESEFAELATTVRDTVKQLVATGQLTAPPTFFEQVTGIALLAFKQAELELAILETGLGGRLDSTTVAQAQTIGITQIALDHQEYLGDSLAEIAGEKAAIIRAGVTAVIAPQAPEALEVILRRCASVGVMPKVNGVETSVRGVTDDGRAVVTFMTAQDQYERVELGLRGNHQVTNVSLALQLAESLRERGFQISRDAIIKGIEDVQHPGRLELIDGNPPILFDGAHNPAGALALRAYLDDYVTGSVTMVFGAMRDKNLEDMARLLFPRARILVLTRPNNPRAAALEKLLSFTGNNLAETSILLEPVAANALITALEKTPAGGLICVTGSLYLIGEIKATLAQSSLALVCENSNGTLISADKV